MHVISDLGLNTLYLERPVHIFVCRAIHGSEFQEHFNDEANSCNAYKSHSLGPPSTDFQDRPAHLAGVMMQSPGAITCAVLAPIAFYAAFLGLLTIPVIQNQVIYLNRFTSTWGNNVNIS